MPERLTGVLAPQPLPSLAPPGLRPAGLCGSVREWGGDIGGNCPAWFPLYISFQKSFHPPFCLLGNSRRKSLTCLNTEHNCPETGPDPNKQGAELSQAGLDAKTQTGAIRIMPQWGNQAWPGLFVLFDCSTNPLKALLFSPLWWFNRLHIFFC